MDPVLALAVLQGAYFGLTAAWALVHIDSFMRVTGAKTDVWLVKTVAALVRKGYLRRVGDKQDRRVHRLVLTEQGESLLRGDPLQQLSRALETLTQEERWALAVNMEKVLRQLIKL